ncbi:MAG: DUF1385 domain-containing protein [Clostridia bacterium]|nr:DUF1385 domain-containing protein [Clostridia bacterium]
MKKEQNCRLGKVGGQAVLEGVMMKSGDDVALAVRKEDGTIEVKRSKHVSIRKKHKILNIPLIRGCVNMVETLIMSMGTLEDSANMIGLDETEDETKFEKWLRKKFGDKLMNVIMGIGMVLGVIMSVGLFVILPNLVTMGLNALCKHFWDFTLPSFAQNAISGVMRIAIFVAYILLVSLMKDIRRTFEYHGAEHKSIACYEAGEELTPENAMKYSRLHPRCGTSFIIVILIISILVTAFINWNTWPKIAIMLTKIAMIPVIVGIGFEFLMWAGKHPNWLTRILSAPGLWMQKATTKEPDRDQLEVAIAALKNAMPAEFPEVLEEEKCEEDGEAEAEVEENEENSDVQ